MDDKARQVMENLKKNPAMAQNLFRSADGRNLLRMLTEQDQGAALQHATQAAARGDPAEMVKLVSQIMQSQEGAELVDRLHKAVDK